MFTLTPEQLKIQSVFEDIKPFLSEKSLSFMDVVLPEELFQADIESTDLHVSFWGRTFTITHGEALKTFSEDEEVKIPTEYSLKKFAEMINKIIENGVVKEGVMLKDKVIMMHLSYHWSCLSLSVIVLRWYDYS